MLIEGGGWRGSGAPRRTERLMHRVLGFGNDMIDREGAPGVNRDRTHPLHGNRDQFSRYPLFDIGGFVVISFLWFREIEMRSILSSAFTDNAAR